MHLHLFDFLLLGLYLIGVVWISFKGSSPKTTGKNDVKALIVGGRRLTLPAFVMSLAATWYGGVLGVGEFTYSYGVSNWTTQAFPYYIFAVLFAWLMVPKIWNAPALSLAEHISQTFGNTAGRLAALFVFLISSPAPYILIVGILLKSATGLPIWAGMAIGTILSSVNLTKGGFETDVKTDQFEFVWMYLGFVVLVVSCVWKLGGLSYLETNLPAAHWSFTGGLSYSYLAVWFLTALWTFIDPSFFQRCKAVANPQVARKGILLSVMCWIVFDFLTLTSGLYAKALLPTLEEPMYSFPLLGDKVLGAGWKGLFFIGMMATVMSTLNSMVLVSSQSLMRDFLKKETVTKLSLGVWICAGLGWLVPMFVPSVVQLWYALSATMVPGLLWPMLLSYFYPKKMSAIAVLMSMIVGVSTSIVWLILGWWEQLGAYDKFPLSIQPMFAGLGGALFPLIIAKIFHSLKRSP